MRTSADIHTEARVGDVVVESGHKVGNVGRSGEILEVLGEPAHQHYRVLWEDGHESLLYPGSDATVHTPATRTTPEHP